MAFELTINDLWKRAFSDRTQGVALTVDSVQNRYRDSFTGTLTDKWDVSLGAGMTASNSGGQLLFASGTTASAVGVLTSKEVFTIPFRFQFGFLMSQRIANQTLYVEMVSVDPDTGVADGLHAAAWKMDGTTATQAVYEVAVGGQSRLSSSASTISTTASLNVLEIEPFADETWFHSAAIDAVAGRVASFRRHQQIPDPTATYKLRIRWVNGATAPASTTTATFQFASVVDNCELTAEITSGRGGSSPGQGVPVILTGGASSATVLGTVNLSATAATAPSVPATPFFLNSAATTNGALIITGTSGVQAVYATNTGASDAFVKLYNKATAPTVGTDVPEMIIPVPAAVSGRPGVVEISPGYSGYRFSLGLGIAVTGAATDADTTAVAASQVKVKLTRTV
jgi:hypothetical protein